MKRTRIVVADGYSIQTLKRLKPDMFREDLTELLNLLQQQRISVVGKIVLMGEAASVAAAR
jgi:hypothetical protein